jgi:hypothetical protein
MGRRKIAAWVFSLSFLAGCGEPATGKKTEMSNQEGWHSSTHPEIRLIEKADAKKEKK